MDVDPAMNGPPLVTIGIPAYGRPEALRQAVCSALEQSYRNLEVIVSDDHSPTDLGPVCAPFLEKDPRIRFVRQERNLGPEGNHVWLREQAEGKYFIWLSDDDHFKPSFIEKAVRLMEGDESIVLAFSDYLYAEEDGQIVGQRSLDYLHPGTDWREGRKDFFRYPYTMAANLVSGMYRLDVLRRVRHPFTNTFRRIMSGHEAPLLAHVVRYGRVVVIPELLFIRTQHSASGASLAHSVSRGLRRWEILLLYATIQGKLLHHAIRVQAPAGERLGLVKTVVGAALRKMKDLPRWLFRGRRTP